MQQYRAGGLPSLFHCVLPEVKQKDNHRMNFEQWKTERAKCLACKHHRQIDDPGQDKPGTILRCQKFKQRGRSGMLYCIDARAEEDKCGFEGKGYEVPSL